MPFVKQKSQSRYLALAQKVFAITRYRMFPDGQMIYLTALPTDSDPGKRNIVPNMAPEEDQP